MVRIGWLSLAPLTFLIAYCLTCGPIGAPAKGAPGELAKRSSLADLRADQKELTELDGQIEADEKELAKLRKKADALRAKVGLGQTWVEIDGKTYGAKPDERGPIGGMAGYKDIVTKGSHRVATLDQLLDALKTAKKGEVVFIDGGAEIDCTERVAVEKLVIKIPAGVTLASNRGQRASQGAVILSDWFATSPLIRPMGPGVRVTGLRLRGPDPKRRMEHHRRSFDEGRGHEYYNKFPYSDGIMTNHANLEVDNCELFAWSHAAVFLAAGDGHRIHHNSMHHCQYAGLGYGICLDKAFALIERNVFNWNRHSVAATGIPESGYEARHNVQLEQATPNDNFHFDIHGGEERGDGTKIGGKYVRIHHNTFRGPAPAVWLRGVPTEGNEIHGNWFSSQTRDTLRTGEKTRVSDNAYGSTKPKLLDPTP
jgi:hypothetical protein